MIFPAFARDTRYDNYWSGALINDTFWGNWNEFGTDSPHPQSQSITWKNRFAEEIDCISGFQHACLRVDLNEDMAGSGYKTLWVSIFADPKSADVGGVLKVESSSSYVAWVYCALFGDISYIGPYTVSDFREWEFAIEVKMNLGFESVTRKYAISANFYKIRKSNNEWIELNSMDKTGEANIEDMGTFNHKISTDYGEFSSNQGTWSAYFNIWDIGIRPDVADENACINILDALKIATEFGKSIDDSYTDWFWNSDCWKADVNCDGIINILDMLYVNVHFGKQY